MALRKLKEWVQVTPTNKVVLNRAAIHVRRLVFNSLVSQSEYTVVLVYQNTLR